MPDFIQNFDLRMEKDENLKKLYFEERLIIRVTNVISECMEEQNLKKVDLAERVGCSKGYITQILDGTANLTLKTISNILFELGCTLTVKAEPTKKFAKKRSEKFRFLVPNYSTSTWHDESGVRKQYIYMEKERIPA